VGGPRVAHPGAIYHAQEAGEDVNEAARDAVPVLSGRVCMDTIESLHEDGFVEAHLVFVDQNRPILHL